MFDVLCKFNFKLNCEKCVFGVKEFIFVGDIIFVEGIKLDEVKVKVIINFEILKSKKDV